MAVKTTPYADKIKYQRIQRVAVAGQSFTAVSVLFIFWVVKDFPENWAIVLQRCLASRGDIFLWFHIQLAQQARQVAQWQPDHVGVTAFEVFDRMKPIMLDGIRSGLI